MNDKWDILLEKLCLPSPVQKIDLSPWIDKEIKLYIKREDKIHPQISGNKWRKLKYNLLKAISEKKKVISFGGAFSNHVYAVAAASKLLSLDTRLYIRGEIDDEENPTLQYCREAGVELVAMTRSAYRNKHTAAVLTTLIKEPSKVLIIPEGGSNELAYRGLVELAQEINDHPLAFDRVTVSAGTGMTAAALADHLSAPLTVYPALKGDFMASEINDFRKLATPMQISPEYHFGGYGKTSNLLTQFINDFDSKTGVPLDPIYTAKMVYGIIQDIKQGKYQEYSKILAIHTGGLQGIAAFNYRWKGRYELIY